MSVHCNDLFNKHCRKFEKGKVGNEVSIFMFIEERSQSLNEL